MLIPEDVDILKRLKKRLHIPGRDRRQTKIEFAVGRSVTLFTKYGCKETGPCQTTLELGALTTCTAQLIPPSVYGLAPSRDPSFERF
jgi:hypothetical protein